MSTLHRVLGVLLHGIRGILQGLVTMLSHTARPLWTSTNPWEGHCAPSLDVDPPLSSGGFARVSHLARPLWTSTNPWEGHCAPPLDVDPPLGSGGFDSWVQGDLQGLVLCFVTFAGGLVFSGRCNVYIVYSR
jgi:hypothetical protein